ncbi:MAG: beta-phosphoglucomutase [Bacteroidota bacterium]
MQIKSCLFDLDGVIVDTAIYHFQAWRRLANELGFDFSEHQNEQLKGISRMESLELILKWGNKDLSQEEKNKWAALKNDWYLELITHMTPKEILPGVKDVLNELKDNEIAIALGSASKNSKMILNKIELFHYFDAIIDGNNITKGKPDPQVFLLGAEATDSLPSECVVFEDAQAGIQAAKAGGMFAVGIGDRKVLSQADLVVNSMEEINLKLLNKYF